MTHLCSLESSGLEKAPSLTLVPNGPTPKGAIPPAANSKLSRAQPFPSLSVCLSCLALMPQQPYPPVQTPRIAQPAEPMTTRNPTFALGFPHHFQQWKGQIFPV